MTYRFSPFTLNLDDVGNNISKSYVDSRSVSHIEKPSSGILLQYEVINTIINNFGQTVNNTQTLPTASAGMNFIAVVGSSGVGDFNIKASASDKIILNGISLDDGDKVSNVTPNIGDYITFFAFKTGVSSFDWIAQTGVGNWIDGGA